MPTIKRFEELRIWQKADEQCQSFYSLIEEGRFDNHKALLDQMDRSSGSVMDNIAEGFDRFTRAEFKQFLIIARGSNAEFRSQLYRSFSRKIIDEQLFNVLRTSSEHLGVQIHHFIIYLLKSEFKQKPSSATWNTDSSVVEDPQSSYGAGEWALADDMIADFSVTR